MNDIHLREVHSPDVIAFFEHQLDPVARQMAAFTATNPADWEAFRSRWDKILADDSIVARTIVCDGKVAGNIVSFERYGEREVGYWLGREFWGRGVATAALAAFLEDLATRPLYARVVKDNVASRRVLEKCGFEIHSEARGFANARGEEVEEYVLRLGQEIGD